MGNDPLFSLQNGSDIRGVAMGEGAALTQEAVGRIARAFVFWLSERTGKPPRELAVGVGHDSRLTADALTRAALDGIGSAGARGFHCGLASTPAMFMGTVYPESAFDGAVMMTASHLPAERNGMKFFTRGGGLEKTDIRALLERAQGEPAPPRGQAHPAFDLMTLYTADLRETIRAGVGGGERPLAGLHVAVDCGNGAGGFFVSQVLGPLGADTAGSRYLEPDGRFPNHKPNPEDAEAMAAICEATVQSGADLGLIFDPDVDRMSAVLPDGTPIARDALIAMIAAILAPEHPGGTIVTDSVTSDHLTDFLERRLGLRHHRFRRGYRNVIGEAQRLEREGVSAPLAIETSGHGAVKENYFLDDGAYLAVRLLIAAAKQRAAGRALAELIDGFVPPFEAREVRIPVRGEDFAAAGAEALRLFEERAAAAGLAIAPNSYEGVRVSDARGWMLLRLSLHDPLLPLNAEGNAPGDCASLLRTARDLLAGIPALDCSVLGSADA